jgi:hypothetical protein
MTMVAGINDIFSDSRILLLTSKNLIFESLKIPYGIKIIKINSYNSSKA